MGEIWGGLFIPYIQIHYIFKNFIMWLSEIEILEKQKIKVFFFVFLENELTKI